MKAFSIHTLALASLALLSACGAQQASVLDHQDSMVDNEMQVEHDGPYLEMDEDDEDSVELNIKASGSVIQ